jgi:hypothetical protein
MITEHSGPQFPCNGQWLMCRDEFRSSIRSGANRPWCSLLKCILVDGSRLRSRLSSCHRDANRLTSWPIKLCCKCLVIPQHGNVLTREPENPTTNPALPYNHSVSNQGFPSIKFWGFTRLIDVPQLKIFNKKLQAYRTKHHRQRSFNCHHFYWAFLRQFCPHQRAPLRNILISATQYFHTFCDTHFTLPHAQRLYVLQSNRVGYHLRISQTGCTSSISLPSNTSS